MNRRLIQIAVLALILITSLSTSSAREPEWVGTVVARGQQRTAIRSTDIVRRPYRPLHFYGNTVRRRHHRGTGVPMPRDVVNGFRAFVVR